MDKEYNRHSYEDLNLRYRFDDVDPAELSRMLAIELRKRRLERGLSREALSVMSGVATSTITKFERDHRISLLSFVALIQALGYTQELKELLSQPKYKTIAQLETINKNKNRKRGRNEFSK